MNHFSQSILGISLGEGSGMSSVGSPVVYYSVTGLQAGISPHY